MTRARAITDKGGVEGKVGEGFMLFTSEKKMSKSVYRFSEAHAGLS